MNNSDDLTEYIYRNNLTDQYFRLGIVNVAEMPTDIKLKPCQSFLCFMQMRKMFVIVLLIARQSTLPVLSFFASSDELVVEDIQNEIQSNSIQKKEIIPFPRKKKKTCIETDCQCPLQV